MTPDKRKAFLDRRAAQQAQAPIAMAEYRAAQQAAIDRIPRLRALRLAREAEAGQKEELTRSAGSLPVAGTPADD